MDAQNRAGILRLPLLILIFSGTFFSTGAQENHLSRKITLTLSSVPMETALSAIAREGKFTFSYNADLFRTNRLVNINVENTRVKTVLDDLFGETIRNKEIGEHVILIPAPVKQEKSDAGKSHCRINGMIVDKNTGNPLKEATVYAVEMKKSVLTDSSGTYTMMIPDGKTNASLSFCKSGYSDTVVYTDCARTGLINIGLSPKERLEKLHPVTTGLKTRSIDSIGLVSWIVPEKALKTSANLRIFGTRPVQVSLIPFIGTNWMDKGSYTNALSLNILAGYNGGVHGFEVGGLLNIDRFNVRGVQIGGLGNIVGNTTYGLQVGGLFNINLGTLAGVQVGGITNILSDTLAGVQISGLSNWCSGTMHGTQVSGLFNLSLRKVDGAQLAGLLNVTPENINKLQVAGFLNYGKINRGTQVAGFINIASETNAGAQIAGFINYGGTLRGFQLGFLNLVDSLESGLPFGFFSVVGRGGYFRIEISGNEVFYGNFALKSGVPYFYNILTIGAGTDWLVNVGYGIGSSFKLSKGLYLTIDLTTAAVFTTTPQVSYHGLLSRLVPALDIRIWRRFSTFFGPAANLYWFNNGNVNRLNGIAPYIIWQHPDPVTGPHTLQFWVGGSAGFRF